MASEEQETTQQELADAIKASMEVAAGRKARSDKGLPQRRSLMLSRAASARFVRVAAALPGGEEELAALLDGVMDELFCGDFYREGTLKARVGTLEDIALAAVAKRMRGGAGDA